MASIGWAGKARLRPLHTVLPQVSALLTRSTRCQIQKKSPRTVTVGEAQLMISPRMVSSQLAAKAREEDWDQLSDTPGVTMSDFTVGRLLGKGQFAEVFRCVHKATGKMFAIKTIRKTSYDSPDCEQRIHHTLVERRILSSLDHPYICRMSYAFQDSYHVYFALEVIEGGDLMAQYVNGPLPIERVRFYSAELVCIIKYLHSRNVIYRDLKVRRVSDWSIPFLRTSPFFLFSSSLRTF